MTQTYEELLADYERRKSTPKDPEEEKRKRHEYYLKRKAEGKIKPTSKEKQAEYSKKYYEKKKAELKAQGLSTYHMGKPKEYNSEKRAEYYQKRKAEGKTQKYYREKKAADPLFNQKEHIKRKARDINWQTVKGSRENFSYWATIIELIRESDLPIQELAQKLSNDWWVNRRYNKPKSKEGKTIYRPRITNTVLTNEQIEQLDNFALSQGLTSQHELIRSTVSYFGELKDIDSREEDKEVDVYTVQEVGKDYSEDQKLHTVQAYSGNREHGELIAQRERERESRCTNKVRGEKVFLLWESIKEK